MAGRKGQSTLEYVLILTAIIAAIIFAATQFMKPRVQSSLDHVTDQMSNQVNKIAF
jgi:hypothetical protein